METLSRIIRNELHNFRHRIRVKPHETRYSALGESNREIATQAYEYMIVTLGKDYTDILCESIMEFWQIKQLEEKVAQLDHAK
ncbi:hypothetical protein P10VF_188 [Rhizobium phage vB_RleM_P10VF]|uniref:Uncharacterized protein n=1 Tax=Rhizobium phage vB_RleM_P10VF TaxID=1527770 RepID=A0A076YQC3_9CAUD|nr:hypothetical protein P10VF_188 [Rhizobium phage vB_RleM_P10VF]AIK68401.1 hypothetical protein P10VF_188 [Rhizobium phage vB_RleM_P10VF]